MADGRQVFIYKGVKYSLSATLTPAEAKAKIQAHLGESTTQPQEQQKASETPQEPQKKKGSTSLWEDIKLGLVGATEAAGKTAGAVGIAAMDKLGYEQEAENLYDKIQRGSKNLRKWANPEESEQGFGGKMVSGIIGMPSLPFQAPNTAMQFLEGGETLPRAYAAGGVDLTSNIAGAFIPGGTTALRTAGKQFAAGAISDYISRGINSEIAQTKEVKRQFTPTIEDALVSGVTGGLLGGLTHQAPKSKVKNPKLDVLKDIDAKKQAAKVEPEIQPEQLELPLETSVQSVSEMQNRGSGQLDLFSSVNEPDALATRATARQQADANVEAVLQAERLIKQGRQAEAQAVIEARQRAIEQEVAQRTSLDQNAAERARQENAPTGYNEWLANRNVDDATRSAEQIQGMNEDPNAQGYLDFNDFGNNDPMSRMPNMRVDENGIPIRADISMEAQNLENPLQMNMWGDELGPALDQTRSLTEAIDSMPPGKARDTAIANVSGVAPGFGTKRYVRPGQGGGQTILNDLGLGIYNTVTKGSAAAKKVLGKIKAGYIKDTEIPSDVPVEDILNNARSTPDTKAINALEAGNSMRGYKGRAQWMHDAGEYLLNRLKRSELNIRNYVTGNTGAEKFMRSLSRNEQIELAGLLKEEMLNRRQFDPADMAAAGFTAKQLEAYAKLRKMQEAALAALNYGRKVHNLPEITAQEAYLTSKWNGEVKMRVEDGEGKLVYYLAGNSERDVRNQFKALVKDNPGYKEGKIDRIKQTFNGSDVQRAYSIMADAIGRDNPEFQKIQEWYSQYQATQAHDSMGTKMHFEDKANIRGFVGDRPGYNPRTEAIALLQEQMNFAKESFHWAALQDAAVALSPIFQDPVIRDTQPNNLKYLQEQLAIAAGANEGAFSRGVNDGIRSLGFTPAQVFGGAQKAKSWFMFQKLSMNLGYGAANLLQLPFTMPHMLDIANKFGGFNPARSLAVATALGAPMAATHYSRQLGGIDLLQNIPDKNFYKSLMDYAEQNGVTSRSIVDEAPLDAGVIGRVGNFTTSAPETVIRSFAFTLFADSLKQTGKLSDMEVFKEAERRTNAALGDFRETQRAPIFSRMGNVGNILNTLQTFGINYYQQMNYFLREALKGNKAPLAAMLITQFGLSGISGMPGVQSAEKGWELIKGILPNNVWAKVGDFDPRIWAYEKFGATGVDGVLSTSTGVSFNSRIGAPAIEEMAQAPGGPIMEVGKQLLSVGQLAMKPEDKVQRAETAMKLLPAGFTGALETGPFRDQTSVDRKDGRMYFKSTDLNKRDAGYVRTPEEEELRKYGFRSTKEVTTRNLEWKQTKYKQELNERRRSFSDSFFDAVMKGDTKKASEIEANAIAVFGKSIVDNTMKTQIQQMYMTSYERAQADAGKLTPTELIRLKNIKSILDKYQ